LYQEERIFLSAAAPLRIGDKVAGALLLTREASDIEEALGAVWIDVLKIFSITFVITIMLSIYLSNTIAQPLRRLARAAENVRTGRSDDREIPDFSGRKDEIGELSLVLRDMMAALWERMDSIESFAADVAHELKNPLTSLRSAVETASVVEKKTDRDKLFDIIKHDVDRLDRLISDISHASRLEAELSREDFQRFNLGEALRQLIDIYKNPLERDIKKGKGRARFHGVEIKIEETGDVYVWGLEERLMQVFQNLISNAVSFSPEKGLVLVHITPGNSHVRVTVEDQGPGIPENKLETIFERFYSERPQHEDFGQHSGLGLSICRQIVEAHRGQIYAENILGGGKVTGAKFTVILNAA
jgi:two-component system sensor histidine kinase ChvG